MATKYKIWGNEFVMDCLLTEGGVKICCGFQSDDSEEGCGVISRHKLSIYISN